MKRSLRPFAIILAMGIAFPLQGSVVSEVIERVIRAGGHVVDDAGRIAAKEALERGMARYGDEVVDLTEQGGFGLAQAAVTHGDEVWRLARMGPEMPRALAARSESLLAIGNRWGDDAVRIEARAPGCGDVLGTTVSKKWRSQLARDASASDIQRIAAFAAHQTPKETEAMLKIWGRSGTRALQFMTPARIASLGFAGALLVTSWKAPEALLGLAEVTLTGLLGPLMMVCSWVIVLAVLIYLRKPLLWLVRRTARLAKSVWSAVRRPDGAS
jgi:hypothetical protein